MDSLCNVAYDESADPNQDASQYPTLCVSVDTGGSTIVDEPKRPVNVVLGAAGVVLHASVVGIELRGSTSQRFPKMQYAFETWEVDNTLWTSGDCPQHVMSLSDCSEAAAALGLSDTTAINDNQNGASDDPPYCYFEGPASACDTSLWSNVDNDVVCGPCEALVKLGNYGTCSAYCSAQQGGLDCVASYTDQDDTCHHGSDNNGCDHQPSSSDDICKCATPGPTPPGALKFNSNGQNTGSCTFNDQCLCTAGFKDVDVSLVGLPSEEDWIFHAPYSDKTLINNVLAFDLSRQMGQYASRCRWMVLSIDGDFKGVYVLMEKLKRDEHRINVTKNEGNDPSGGWVVKKDKSTAESNPNWRFDAGTVELGYHYPSPDDITPEQAAYIEDYFVQFEAALSAESPLYEDYIDIASWIDYFMIIELTREVDAYRLSAYFSKERNGKLKAGPVWDQNLGFGNANYCGGGSTAGWAYLNCEPENVPWWWVKLLQERRFVGAVQARWAVLRDTVFSLENINGLIDGYVQHLGAAIDANFDRWDILNSYVWPNPWPYYGQTHEMYITRIKTWIAQRLTWLDAAVQNLNPTWGVA